MLEPCAALVYHTGSAPSRVQSLVTELLIILPLVLANGVFAGAEIAVLSLRKTRVRELADEGSSRAAAILHLRSQPERFLATVQVGITVISAAAAAFGGATVAEALAPVLAQSSLLAPYADRLALGLVIAFVSYLSLVLGELVPKSLALRSAEQYALLVARPLLWLSTLARPLAWLLTTSSNVVLRPFGDSTTFAESRLSTEELQALVDEATRQGQLDSRSGEIASRALEFGDLTAGAVMVPRAHMALLAADATADDIQAVVVESGQSRIAVHKIDEPDEIVGYVRLRDLLSALLQGHGADLMRLLRPVHYVPKGMRAGLVLAELQQKRSQLALVVDEHGAVLGCISPEDLVEELVGELAGESDQPEQILQREADDVVVAAGSAPVRELNRALGIELPESDDWSTLGGLCSALRGSLPQRGDRLVEPDSKVVLEILAASPRAVGLVRLYLPEHSNHAS